MSYITHYLEAEIKLMTRRNPEPQPRNGWRSISEFVLNHGRHWKPRALPDEIKPGKMRECFKNAADLALGFHRNNYIYCEGYALSIIPVMHAWCVDLEGNVIDPTWTPRTGAMIDTGREYFGVAIKSAYLSEALLKQKYYGLIDAWQSKWPLLTAPVADWKHPVNSFVNQSLKGALAQ
ncbi:MAG: hypothetical protein ACTHLW_20350 [Verrucomicrobiota bacterium]